ncbi:MAG: hypothetical protein ACE5JQ_12450 [Candidatus Methylomirabilales bacterium]
MNITRDVIRLRTEGRSLEQIRVEIDRAYGKYGPGTPTPWPPA